MTLRQVVATANDIDIISMEITGTSGISRFSFQTRSSAFSLNDAVTIYAGFEDEGATLVTGALVDTVTAEQPPGLYRIEGRDKLKKALDYFIVAASLDEADFFNPRLDNGSTSPTAIIDDILDLCGLGSVTGSAAGWELGSATDGTPFQLISAWDAIQQVCSIGAWRVWVSAAGNIIFGPITTPVGDGGTLAVGDDGEILSAAYSKSDDDLRNKIVAIGANGDYLATASAVSPYLPAGFYKTAVISTDLIGSQSAADATAAANLTALNRLTERTTLECTGVGVELYNTVGVTEPFTSAPGGMITSVTHTIDNNGYRTRLTVTVV